MNGVSSNEVSSSRLLAAFPIGPHRMNIPLMVLVDVFGFLIRVGIGVIGSRVYVGSGVGIGRGRLIPGYTHHTFELTP